MTLSDGVRKSIPNKLLSNLQERASDMFPNYFSPIKSKTDAYAHLLHHNNSDRTKYSNLLNTIKCNCTTFGLHISMERQMESFLMSQNTMIRMVGISQCAASILLCIVVTFCALHTFARFPYIMVNFKVPPNFVCSGHIK